MKVKLHGNQKKIMTGQVLGNSVVSRWWQVCVCVCLLSSSLFFNLFLSSFLPQVGTASTWQTEHTAKGKTGWATADDVTPATAGWWWSDGLCVYAFVFMHDSVSAVEAVLVKGLLWPPLLLHYSQFTTKHPHKSVQSYLWGDSKMSMGFRPHYTDLKTFNGTFKTTNGF